MVLGAGGHAKTVLATAESSGTKVKGILDQQRSKDEHVLNYPLLGPISRYIRHLNNCRFFIAIGDNATRMAHHQTLSVKKAHLATLIHPTAQVDPSAEVQQGSLIAQSAILCPHAHIGENVIINSRALIEHDVRIDAHAHIGPDASLAGRVHIGEGAFVGLRSVIKDGVRVGAWTKVGAGAVVVHDVPDGATVVGNPARVMSMDEHPKKSTPKTPVFSEDMAIRDALELMDYIGYGHGIVVDPHNKALGLITDGTIRRHILSNYPIDVPVASIMNVDFFFLNEAQEAEAMHHFSHLISFIPILSDTGQLIKTIEKSDVFSTAPKAESLASSQLNHIFQWLSKPEHPKYHPSQFIQQLEKRLKHKICHYHSCAQTLLEVMLSQPSSLCIDTCAQKLLDQRVPTLQELGIKRSDQASFTISHIDNWSSYSDEQPAQLWLGSSPPPQNFDSSHQHYFMFCDQGDELQMGGAGLLFGPALTLPISPQLHPFQIALSQSQIKSLKHKG